MEKYLAIVKEMRDKAATHAANVDAWKQEIEEARSKAAAATSQKIRAAGDGKNDEYKAAAADEAYWNARVQGLQAKCIQSVATFEEVQKYCARLEAAKNEFVAPLYAEIVEMQKRYDQICTALESFAGESSLGLRSLDRVVFSESYKDNAGKTHVIPAPVYVIPADLATARKNLFAVAQILGA